MSYKVYQATHVPTGKIYVGLTKGSIISRVGQHLQVPEYRRRTFQHFLHTTEYNEWKWDVVYIVDTMTEGYKAEAEYIADCLAQGKELLNESGNTRKYADPRQWFGDNVFKKGQAAWNKGKVGVSEGTRQKMRMAKLRKPSVKSREQIEHDAKNSRKLLGKKIICNETGERYESIAQAAEHIGAARSSVRLVLQGKQGNVKGYTFRYETETNEN